MWFCLDNSPHTPTIFICVLVPGLGWGGLCGSTSWKRGFFRHHQCCDYTKPNLGRVSWGKKLNKKFVKAKNKQNCYHNGDYIKPKTGRFCWYLKYWHCSIWRKIQKYKSTTNAVITPTTKPNLGSYLILVTGTFGSAGVKIFWLVSKNPELTALKCLFYLVLSETLKLWYNWTQRTAQSPFKEEKSNLLFLLLNLTCISDLVTR